MARCGACREDNPERARFCLACGNQLAAPDSIESRKIITVLFADLVNSTGIGQRLDPETLRSVIGRYFEAMKTTIEAHGGTVEKFIGDAVMAVFGVPIVHEDDALRAVRAAIDMQASLTRLADEMRDPLGIDLQMRIGINTGEVLAGTNPGEMTGVLGDTVNTAARLEKLAEPGGIVIGPMTHLLVRASVRSTPLGDIAIRGRDAPIEAVAVTGLVGAGGPRRFDAALVGRERELDALLRSFEGVVADHSCALFTLFGSAGVGKSRLAREFKELISDRALVATGRCLPYGEGITFWPIAEAVSEAAGITDRDSKDEARAKLAAVMADLEDGPAVVDLVGQVLGLGQTNAGQEETFWAIRRLFASLASTRPLVLLFDDIHWAEPTFLDLIDHLVSWSNDLSLEIVCLARPELLEDRPSWGGGKLNSTTVNLESLRQAEAEEMFANLMGGPVSGEVAKVLEAAEGNPLFLEEMVAMLVDDGVIVRSDGGWAPVKPIQDVSIPPTINALLGARLERLSGGERSAIAIASVMGKIFSAPAVADLTDDLDSIACLESLAQKGLLRPEPAEAGGERMFRFRHILIRDAAYNQLPKERRADLHEHYGEWLIDAMGERVAEYEEIIGYHFETAHAYRTELTIRVEQGSSTGRRAAKHLADAGRRALGRGDMSAATNLLTRATAVLPRDDPERARALLDLGEALWENGDYAHSEAALLDTIDLARSTGDRIIEARAQLGLDECHIHSRTDKSVEETKQIAEAAIVTFEELNDNLGLAHAWRLLSWAYDTLGQAGRSHEALTRAIHHARASGDARRESQYRRVEIQSLSWGPTSFLELEPKVHDFVQWARDNGERRAQALGSGVQAVIAACRGDFDRARQLVAAQRAIQMEMGLEIARAWSVFEATTVELLAGDLDAAETELRWSCQTLQKKEEKAVLPTVLALLADVRCSQGDLTEAEALVNSALLISVEDDVLTQSKGRSTLARVRARQGLLDEATLLAERAIELINTTEFLDWRANALMDASEVFAAAGDPDRSAQLAHEAIDLYEKKGMSFPATRARERLAGIVA